MGVKEWEICNSYVVMFIDRPNNDSCNGTNHRSPFSSQVLTRATDGDGGSPASLAAYHGHPECLKVIAQVAPDTFAVKDRAGMTSAHWAAMKDHPECLGIIAGIATGTLTVLDQFGATPALVAAPGRPGGLPAGDRGCVP